jgi:cyclopropane-fatty-acyl-phospholipid synthase
MDLQPTGTEDTGVFRLFLAIMRRMRIGELVIVLPGGERHRQRGDLPGPSAEIRFHRRRVVRRFLLGGATGFAESYIDGDWSSPDLPRLLELLALNEAAFAEAYYGKPWFRVLDRLRHALRSNTRRGSRRNIHAHYDLGNAFYRAWLDETMSYSAAIFDDPAADLAEAQRRKLRRVVEQLGPRPGDHVLEIGCGWGSFAEIAAKEFGVRVTGITISRAQHEFAQRRVFEEGLADRVEIRLCDYRDVTGRFDHVASIEMFEAVGERYWPVFFGKLREVLAAGGRTALQVITIHERNFESYRRAPDFIQKYIFPGGMLPSRPILRRLATDHGFALADEHRFGACYARTLAEWNRRFQAVWPSLRPHGFDERFKRIWEYYLAYCEAGFRTDNIDVVQLSLARA